MEKKSGKGSNDHMIVGNGEMENITVVKSLEMKGGPARGEGRRLGRGTLSGLSCFDPWAESWAFKFS